MLVIPLCLFSVTKALKAKAVPPTRLEWTEIALLLSQSFGFSSGFVHAAHCH